MEGLTLLRMRTAQEMDFRYSGGYCIAYLSMSGFLQLLGVLAAEDWCRCPSLGTIYGFILAFPHIPGQPASSDIKMMKAGLPLLNLGQL